MLRSLSKHLCTALAVSALLLTAGCGGGGGGGGVTVAGEVGSGGTGYQVVSGFGSLILDGTRHNDASASFMTEEDQGSALAMAPTGVMLGHTVEYGYDASGNMASVMISPELVGTVSAVTPNSITVLSTRVTINSSTATGPVTALQGYSDATAIQMGDRVAVYGSPKTDSLGTAFVQATLISQKTTGTGVRLTGVVSQYSASAKTFVIGGNTVNVSAAMISPAGNALANGELVTVWSNVTPVDSTIAASTVRIKLPASVNGNLTLSGAISGFVSTANFKIGSLTLDASSAAITPSGTALADSRYIVAVGKFDASTNKLTATSVTVYAPPASTAVELHGSVMHFVSPASFVVRGVAIDASSASVVGGSLADLVNGAYVEVIGAVTNNTVKATSLQIVTLNPLAAPMGSMLDLSGKITSFDTVTGNYTMTLASGTVVSASMGTSIFYSDGTASNFAVGQSINVRGMMNGNSLATSVVGFVTTPASSESSTGTGITHMEGVASNVTDSSFMLNGLTIQRNGVTVTGGGMMGSLAMMSGARVGVNVKLVAGQYIALAINLMNA